VQYLLDSDAVIDYINGVQRSVHFLEGFLTQGDGFCTCAVVVAEVFSGLMPERLTRGEQILESCLFLDETFEIGRRAGEWRFDFRRRGLSVTDTIIAATAYENQAAIITGNVSDFRIPELNVVALPRANRRF